MESVQDADKKRYEIIYTQKHNLLETKRNQITIRISWNR